MYEEFSDDRMERMEGHGGSNSVYLHSLVCYKNFKTEWWLLLKLTHFTYALLVVLVDKSGSIQINIKYDSSTKSGLFPGGTTGLLLKEKFFIEIQALVAMNMDFYA